MSPLPVAVAVAVAVSVSVSVSRSSTRARAGSHGYARAPRRLASLFPLAVTRCPPSAATWSRQPSHPTHPPPPSTRPSSGSCEPHHLASCCGGQSGCGLPYTHVPGARRSPPALAQNVMYDPHHGVHDPPSPTHAPCTRPAGTRVSLSACCTAVWAALTTAPPSPHRPSTSASTPKVRPREHPTMNCPPTAHLPPTAHRPPNAPVLNGDRATRRSRCTRQPCSCTPWAQPRATRGGSGACPLRAMPQQHAQLRLGTPAPAHAPAPAVRDDTAGLGWAGLGWVGLGWVAVLHRFVAACPGARAPVPDDGAQQDDGQGRVLLCPRAVLRVPHHRPVPGAGQPLLLGPRHQQGPVRGQR